MPGDPFSGQLGLLDLSPTASGGGCPSIVAAEVAVVRRVLASTLKETLSHIALRASWHGNRPGRNGTCNPRFWSPLLATPALHRLLIFNDLALGQQRRRRWTPPALALILTLRKTNSDAPQGRGKDPLSALDESASAFAPRPLPSARGTRSRTGARHRAPL